ncbi:L,D-transpeptidase [uncultured Propionivibrio sp.]|uniref:L,D-transpeptidase n=1 Tax=uncultured Propionivibrio sp. TaxID=426737 RepID=UPI0029C0357A|nr:L,D-transpeptidase [uncultured Propionivibrio sp.]
MKVRVSLSSQRLFLLDDDGRTLGEWPVSTALRGAGEARNSLRTPRGRHVIRAKIGAGQPENTVFVARRPSGEILDAELAAAHPNRDWILTRILWLSGCEPGRNRLGNVDTMRRYIYIHGTSESEALGRPASHGCIRMGNADIIDFFDRVPVYTPVDIDED